MALLLGDALGLRVAVAVVVAVAVGVADAVAVGLGDGVAVCVAGKAGCATNCHKLSQCPIHG